MPRRHGKRGWSGAKKPKPSWYGVRLGHKVGLFPTWGACQAAVRGFPRAEFKGFPSKAEAHDYVYAAAAQPVVAAEGGGPVLDVWTDGSLLSGGGMGVGAYYRSGGKARVMSRPLSVGELKKELGLARVDLSSSLTELEALRYALLALPAEHRRVRAYIDNDGVRLWLKGSWEAKSPTILAALRRLREAIAGREHVEVVAVDGHAGVEENEAADRLANAASRHGAGDGKFHDGELN